MAPESEDGARSHRGLDQRLRARALVLALRSEVSVHDAAEDLIEMAGRTPAAPIALGRALRRLEAANALRPNNLTAAAVEALGVAHARSSPTGPAGLGPGR